LEEFRRLGASVLSSDAVVHAIYADPAVIAAVRDRFGDAALGDDGTVDRTALAALAFAQPDGLRFLEQLVHPRVGEVRVEWERAERARVPPPPLLVCEVPLLFEAGLQDAFDAVLVVTAPEEVRRARVAARGQDFSARSGNQVTEADKVGRADRYVVNDGSIAALGEWVAARFEEYRI
jgi:dephospho-CoA kinase